MQWLIHGHTHRPAVHELIMPIKRLFAWYWVPAYRRSMVKVTADDVELIHFPFLTTNGQILKKAPNYRNLYIFFKISKVIISE